MFERLIRGAGAVHSAIVIALLIAVTTLSTLRLSTAFSFWQALIISFSKKIGHMLNHRGAYAFVLFGNRSD
mgnify:CR=1 FL=1